MHPLRQGGVGKHLHSHERGGQEHELRRHRREDGDLKGRGQQLRQVPRVVRSLPSSALLHQKLDVDQNQDSQEDVGGSDQHVSAHSAEDETVITLSPCIGANASKALCFLLCLSPQLSYNA